MDKKINLWWFRRPSPGNFGDLLSPHILKKLGFEINYVGIQTHGKFMCIGSTAEHISKGDTVWGTGIMHISNPIEKDANYLAVRGPLTGEKVGCKVYGDPGLLCSYFWSLERKDTKPLGIIPHYVDYNKYDVGGNDQINVLNVNPIEVIEKIVKYDSIVSSSLHGIIVAHSYGIPAGWWRPSDRLAGDDSKFKDYSLSVGIELTPEKDYKKVRMVLPEQEKIKQIQKNLLNAIQAC